MMIGSGEAGDRAARRGLLDRLIDLPTPIDTNSQSVDINPCSETGLPEPQLEHLGEIPVLSVVGDEDV